MTPGDYLLEAGVACDEDRDDWSLRAEDVSVRVLYTAPLNETIVNPKGSNWIRQSKNGGPGSDRSTD